MFRSDESGERTEDLAADAPGVPAVTAASWRSAETQLFSTLMSRPDLYRGVIVLVGATADRLRRLGPSTNALLDAASTIVSLVREASEQGGSRAADVDPDLVGRAALALRLREVVAEQAAARRLDLLAAARANGTAWVVLEEAGDWAGDPLVPYHRLEAEAATGRAILVTATPDDDFRSSRHAVEVLHVDLDTGWVEESRIATDEDHGHPSAADREDHVTTLRERISQSG
jgi:hypothetical protein